MQAGRETLIARRVCETEWASLQSRLSADPEMSRERADLRDDYEQEDGGFALRLAGPDHEEGVALNEAEQVAMMKGISVTSRGHRSASSAADSVVYAGPQKYRLV
jgi:hypothetical protein